METHGLDEERGEVRRVPILPFTARWARRAQSPQRPSSTTRPQYTSVSSPRRYSWSLTRSQFSQDLVNQLSDQITSPNVTPERQATLDAHVRSRIQAEMAKLRQEEQEVMRQITTALEKENIDREKALDGADSASLKHDLEEMQARIKAFEGRKRLATEFPQVQHARDALVACYKCVMCSRSICYLHAHPAQEQPHDVSELLSRGSRVQGCCRKG